MKVLFLDIDGVVNSENTFFKTRGERESLFVIDPYMAFLVARIVEQTGCKIVLSSSWRHHPYGIEVVEKRVWKIYDVTPTIPLTREEMQEARERGVSMAEYCERGKEIEAWLDANPHPKVLKYAILDDDSDFFPDQPHFKTSWKQGLTDEIAQQVIDHLNK